MSLALWGATLCVSLGALIIALGIAIFREDPRQRPNRWAALMLSFGGLGALLVGFGLAARGTAGSGVVATTDAAQYFSYLWEFFFPSLLLFVLVFPREPRWYRRIPFFEVLVFTPYIFHLLLTFAARLSNETFWIPDVASRSGWASPFFATVRVALGLLYEAHQVLFSLVNLAYVVVTLLVLGVRLREVTSPRLRDQLRAISLGLGACLVLYSAAVPLPTVFGVGGNAGEGLRAGLLVFALALGSGSIAYAIVRYRFLDAGVLVRRGILFLLPALGLILVYMGLSNVVTSFMRRWSGIDPRLVEPLLLLMLVSTLPPIVSRLEEVVEGYLSRDRREGRTVIQNLSRDIVTLLDLETLAGRLTHAVGESLLTERCVLLQRAGDRFEPVASFDRAGGVRTGGELALDTSLCAWAHALPAEGLAIGPSLATQVVDGWPPELVHEAEVFLETTRSLDMGLLVPVRHREEALGVIALGRKITGGRFSREDLFLLETLANQTGAAMRTASLYTESVRRVALEEELSLARQIQFGYLPTTFPRLENLDVFGMNQPSKEVGGDYFDVMDTGDSFLTAIADVSGKGVPAALVMSMMQASLRTQASEDRPVREILARINTLMLARGESGMFATCFLGRLDPKSLELVYTNAGHNPPLLLRADGRIEVLHHGGLLLGVFEDPRLEEGRVRLQAGDRLLLYTDGVTEARTPNGEFFGEEGLMDVLRSMDRYLSAEEIVATVKNAVRAFAGSDDFEDDMTMVVLRVPERRPSPVPAPEDEPSREPVFAPTPAA
ncbi:MAG: PP2C family protein-serine/threonine phosphatase [Candidatus Eiseniibacteriota bacterium]